jgi:cystathionine gamma-synthase
MTHAGMEESARLKAGIGTGLLRVSVGIEDAGDLVADIAAGLERAASLERPAGLERPATASPERVAEPLRAPLAARR